MSNIYIPKEELENFKKIVPSSEEIIYATYAKIGFWNKGKNHLWKSPIVITNKRIFFIYLQPISFSEYEQGIKAVPLYKTHVFKDYKHIYISDWDFRPIHNEKSGETKKEFKNRKKEFQKVILPYVIESQREHLKEIELKKDDSEFYNKKDLKNMHYFGTEKKLEKHIRKILPKFESKLEKLT
ncbi:MAG: hypothetical protein EU547_02890 [Promethearchaeota archaeon]|nr:MAG: hypothetical protein EU547_02890 [Candidatus Lokiarchaeota archaeon]